MKKRTYVVRNQKGEVIHTLTGTFKSVCKRMYGSKVTIERLTRKMERELLEKGDATQ